MKVIITVLTMLFFLSGCGALRARVKARNRMEVARHAYVECLESKDDPSECQRLRRIFEIEIETYKALRKRPGAEVVIKKQKVR